MSGRLLALSDLHIGYPEISVGYPREWRRRGAAPPAPRVILG